MSKARPRDNPVEHLTRSEAEAVIREANLGLEDSRIAQMYLIDKLPQLDIAIELMLDRKTVGARLREVERKLHNAMHKISP